MPRYLCCGAYITALLWSGQLRAATVGVLEPAGRSPSLSEAVVRLEGELSAVGLAVELETRPDADADMRLALGQLRNARHLAAILDIIGEKNVVAIHIWLYQPGSQLFEKVQLEANPTSDNPSASLAISAVEVVRSNLIERGLLARSASAERPAPPPEVPRSEVSPPISQPTIGLEGGVSALASAPHVGLAFLPLVRLDWAVSDTFTAQATVAGVGTRPTISTDAGSAQLAYYYGLLSLRRCIFCDSRLQAFAGLGLGVLKTSIEGQSDWPERAHTVSQTSFLIEGAAGALSCFSKRYFLAFSAHLQLTQPYVRVHIADEVAATTGRPNGALSLALGAWL